MLVDCNPLMVGRRMTVSVPGSYKGIATLSPCLDDGCQTNLVGPFWLDGQNECLWHGSQAISLRPKPFAVLKLLLAHAGQLVSKQQLLDSVWPERLSATPF